MPNNKREEVLNCPFCNGGRAEAIDVFDFINQDGKQVNLRHIVRCFHCGSQTRELGSESAAIEKWNTRTGAASIDRVQVVREAFNSVKIEASLQDCLIRDVDWFKAMDVVLAEIEGDGK